MCLLRIRATGACQHEVLREVLTQLGNTLRDEGIIDERERCIDATFAAAKGGGEAVGLTKRGKGVKILAIVDRQGLMLSVSTHAANHHEVTLVQLSSSSPCWRPSRSISSVIARMTAMDSMTTANKMGAI